MRVTRPRHTIVPGPRFLEALTRHRERGYAQLMCRWLAYSGSPIFLEELLYKPEHSLIDQSLHSRLGVETTNGDGYGVGWYLPEERRHPGTLKGVGPAWGSRNLREVA